MGEVIQGGKGQKGKRTNYVFAKYSENVCPHSLILPHAYILLRKLGECQHYCRKVSTATVEWALEHSQMKASSHKPAPLFASSSQAGAPLGSLLQEAVARHSSGALAAFVGFSS